MLQVLSGTTSEVKARKSRPRSSRDRRGDIKIEEEE